MKHSLQLTATATLLLFSYASTAKENVGGSATSHNQFKSAMALCAPASAKEDLDINNVRTTILAGGDMWWDLTNGKYLVPKPAPGMNGPTALFAGIIMDRWYRCKQYIESCCNDLSSSR